MVRVREAFTEERTVSKDLWPHILRFRQQVILSVGILEGQS